MVCQEYGKFCTRTFKDHTRIVKILLPQMFVFETNALPTHAVECFIRDIAISCSILTSPLWSDCLTPDNWREPDKEGALAVGAQSPNFSQLESANSVDLEAVTLCTIAGLGSSKSRRLTYNLTRPSACDFRIFCLVQLAH